MLFKISEQLYTGSCTIRMYEICYKYLTSLLLRNTVTVLQQNNQGTDV